MKNWTEFRTAFWVAQHGSVSGASKALGVHRATVLMHLDIIEEELGAKIFIREAQRYQLTEVGSDLLRVAKLTEEQLNEFQRRAKGSTGELSGEFILASVEALSELLSPVVRVFNRQHPRVRVRWLTGSEFMKLEYGQAHVAIRSGPKPQNDDYVVQPLNTVKFGLFAGKSYLDDFGMPIDTQSLTAHKFVSFDQMPASLEVSQWFSEHVKPEQLICTSNSREVLENAVAEGIGIGCLMSHRAAQYPEIKRVLPFLEWSFQNWILTHGDLHRAEKVQAFLRILKTSVAKIMLSNAESS